MMVLTISSPAAQQEVTFLFPENGRKMSNFLHPKPLPGSQMARLAGKERCYKPGETFEGTDGLK